MRVLVGSLLLLALGACADPAPPPRPPGGRPPRRELPPQKSAVPAAPDLEQLGALGYIGFSPTPADTEKRGVVLDLPGRVAPGYNLTSHTKLCKAELFDHTGAVVRTWHRAEGCGHWANVKLLPGGHLLAVTAAPPKKAGYDDGERSLLRFAFDGTLVWERRLPVHHDVEALPDGRLLVLTRSRRQTAAHGEIEDNQIVVLDADGAKQEMVSLYDILSRQLPKELEVPPPRARALRAFDLLHANTVSYVTTYGMSEPPMGLGKSNVLVTLRHRDLVLALDWKDKRVTFSIGPGYLDGPHDAQLTARGTLLVFDNGWKRGYSRLVELDPKLRGIVWEYKAPQPKEFYTASRGSVQELENGNYLVTVSDDGFAFEVTRQGERVWEYWSPYFNDDKRRSTLEQVKRYPQAMVDKLLGRPVSVAQPGTSL